MNVLLLRSIITFFSLHPNDYIITLGYLKKIPVVIEKTWKNYLINAWVKSFEKLRFKTVLIFA